MRIESTTKNGQVISVELPHSSTPQDIAAARHELDRVSRECRDSCPICFVPKGVVHFTDCSLASENIIENLRKEAGIL